MKAYVRHMLAFLAAVFGSQASIGMKAEAQDSAESQAWASAKDEDTKQAYEIYLSTYPIGAHAREAFTKIIQLSNDQEKGIARSLEELGDGDVFLIQPVRGARLSSLY